MRTLQSVLLPEPFLPMMAWISPERIVRVRPLRISWPLSAISAWRFVISKVCIVLFVERLL